MAVAGGITGLILAGGRGRRMGGRDKGLLPFRGRPLAAAVAARLAPQVERLLISANRNLDDYAAFGHAVVQDRVGGFAGPLAGLEAGLAACGTPLLLAAPCDTPFLPEDLASRLRAALEASTTEIAVARTPAREHPAVCLVRREALAGLSAFLAAGGRRVAEWQAGLRRAAADFEDEAAFANFNTPEDFGAREG
ncbi:MAG TPA: molybdenum cofactor guanylyltransferase MobA [Candidatus Desulfobacillus sp.]|nr:molybdenum cofactor guanylyltransferase MobA [Candidatus Desulfobacillus sp.]